MNVLAIGAHPDDIELGCAGALLAHQARGDRVLMLVLTAGERGPQEARSRVAEQEDAAELLGAELYWGGFEDCALPDDRTVVERVEKVLAHCAADTVYVHVPRDSHQDHRGRPPRRWPPPGAPAGCFTTRARRRRPSARQCS